MDLNEQECEQRPSAKSNHIAEPSCESTGPMSQSLRTCESSQQQMFPESMSSAEGFLARTSASQERAPALKANGLDYGDSMPGLLARYDRDTSSWRTSQLCLDGDYQEFSETWPRSGMTRNGKAYLRPPLVPHISGTGFGYLPTPDKSLGTLRGGDMASADATTCLRKETHGTRKSGAKIGSSLRWSQEFIREWLRTGGYLNPVWLERLMGFPDDWSMLETELSETPSCQSSRKSSGGQS